jgi:hypothetical protein
MECRKTCLPPAEQPFDVGKLELHVGGPAVIALAGVRLPSRCMPYTRRHTFNDPDREDYVIRCEGQDIGRVYRASLPDGERFRPLVAGFGFRSGLI